MGCLILVLLLSIVLNCFYIYRHVLITTDTNGLCINVNDTSVRGPLPEFDKILNSLGPFDLQGYLSKMSTYCNEHVCEKRSLKLGMFFDPSSKRLQDDIANNNAYCNENTCKKISVKLLVPFAYV
jgi:hypothetical protein